MPIELKSSMRVILMAIVLVILGAVFRPPMFWVNIGLPSDTFWMSKAFNTKTYDIVLAGDSRVFRGISPGEMQYLLKGLTIFNFGFDHNGYSDQYLKAVDKLINRSSNFKAVVLGISPQSLTLEAAGRNGFLSLRKVGHFERFVRLHLSRYLDIVKPYNFYSLYSLIHDKTQMKYIQDLRADGWAASRKEPETPNYQIGRYKGRFDNNKVSVQLEDQLFKYIRAWTKEGTCVFGLRIPTSAAMLALENSQSGFNRQEFIQKFEAAGGVWLDFNLTAYHSYDGSHLRADAARAFSVDLATAIHANMKRCASVQKAY
jgi:hypothetical protein